MLDQDEATRRVARGLSWLKESGERHGFHVQDVNLALLDVGSHRLCVLAQASGSSYIDVWHQLKFDDDWFAERGFNLTAKEATRPDYASNYRLLTATWREAIAEERLRTAATLILAA